MKKKIAALIGITAMTVMCTACQGKNEPTVDDLAPKAESNINTTEHPTEAPENYVDNSKDLYEITDEERYFTDDAGNRIFKRDEQVFCDGVGFQFFAATNMLSTDTSVSQNSNSGAICIADYKDQIDKFVIGDNEYAYSDLIMTKADGGKVLEKLATDFGIDVYDENGNRVETAYKSDSLDDLRKKFSESEDFEEYSARTYYIHADMNAFDDDSEKEGSYAGIISDKERDNILYGTMALILYYDPDGYDYFYTIVMDAPAYYNDDVNFEANKKVKVRHDITKCHMTFKDWPIKVGFLNNTAISVTNE